MTATRHRQTFTAVEITTIKSMKADGRTSAEIAVAIERTRYAAAKIRAEVERHELSTKKTVDMSTEPNYGVPCGACGVELPLAGPCWSC